MLEYTNGRRYAVDSCQDIYEWWRHKNIQTSAELAEVLNAHCISFAYHSGKIENPHVTYFDTSEVFSHDRVSGYTGDLRTLFELHNAKDAYELFLRSFGLRRSLNESLLLESQLQLTQSTYDGRRWELGERPGTCTQHDYVTGRFEIGASPETVREEVQELLLELEENLIDVRPQNVLTAAAYFHAEFENIHPFADGNGRTGRLAMNYVLVLRVHPPIIIHEEDQRACYAALEVCDTAQDLEAMRSFLEDQLLKTWNTQLQRSDS